MIKVFISSKQGELDAERTALHRAFQSPEWDNFAVEFSGAFPDSVRDVFLKHVAECDVYLGIFASIYSQPTIDEYHKAKELGKPILIYVKKRTKRDAQLDDFILAELQPFHKYQEFSTIDELKSHLPDIRRALSAEVQKHQRQAYLNALVTQTELLELTGIVDIGEQERPQLSNIFIALSAAEERDERQSKEKREHELPSKITRRVTINEALREHRNLMILGDPGAGKSTLLRYLTLVLATTTADHRPQTTDKSTALSSAVVAQESRLPILIRLSSFAQSGQSFVDYFESYAEKQLNVSLGKKFFELALEEGQALVCLDGLDEVSQPARRIEVRNAILALANRYPRNRFIVTSRVAGYANASLDKHAFTHHTIVPFSEKDIQSFVEKWYVARERAHEQPKTRAKNLFNDLKANERLLKLAENPLTLTLIALVHQRTQDNLPATRVELYDRCAETLIDEWDKWKGLAPEDRARPYYRLRRRLLERAAYWMHIESPDVDVAQMSKGALEMKIAEFLVEDKTLNLSSDTAQIEAQQFVTLATHRTGILVERERGGVSFIHLTFQEYFVAADLYWRYHGAPDALWRAIQPQLYDSRWQEIILLLLGRLQEQSDLPGFIVEKILGQHDKFDDVIHRELFLAAKCLAAGVKVPDSLQNKIVDSLLKFANEKYPKYELLRDDSIDALGSLRGNERACKGLLALAQDRWDSVQGHAVQQLGELGCRDDIVIRYLIALAKDRGIYSQSSDALRALGKLGRTDDVVVHNLIGILQDEERHESFRSAAAETLGELGCTDDIVVDGLMAVAQDQKIYGDVRFAATRALVQLGCTDDAVPLLFAFAQAENRSSYSARYHAMYQLVELGRSNDAAMRYLITLVQDQKIENVLRSDIVRAIGNSGRIDHVMLRSLIALVQNKTEDERVRRAAAETLGELGFIDEVVIHELIVAAKNTNKNNGWLRCDAAQALGKLGRTDDAVRWLSALVQDEKVSALSARSYALSRLCRLAGSDEAVELLLKLLHDKNVDESVRSDAARELGKLGRTDDLVVGSLMTLSQDNKANWQIRSTVVQALVHLGRSDDAVRDALLEKLEHEPDSFQLTDAAQALIRLGHASKVVVLFWNFARKEPWYLDRDFERVLGLPGSNIAKVQRLLEWVGVIGPFGRTIYTVRLLMAIAQSSRLSSNMRCSAVQVLGHLAASDNAALRGLLILLQKQEWDSERDVNKVIRETLWGLGRTDKAAIHVLSTIAQGNNEDAAQALGQLVKKSPGVALALLRLANCKSSRAQNTAYRELKKVIGNLKYVKRYGFWNAIKS